MVTTSIVLFLFILFGGVDLRPPQSEVKVLDLRGLLKGQYYSKGFNGSWFDGSTLQWMTPITDTGTGGDLIIVDLKSRPLKPVTVIKGEEFARGIATPPSSSQISPLRSHILVGYNPQRIFRHSLVADYAIFDVATRTFSTFVETPEGEHQNIQLVKWSPRGGVSFAYVRHNNVFYYEEDGTTTQVSKTGSHVVFNGVTDWVYEEEVFSSNEAMWFSGSGRYLAYATFNDSLVDLIHYPLYGEPGSLQYPILESLPYPKAGRANPTAVITVFDTVLKTNQQLLLPLEVKSHYISWVGWSASDSSLLVTTLNRFQNESWTFSCPQQGNNKPCELLRLVSESSGWIDVTPIIPVTPTQTYATLSTTFDVDAKYKHAVLFTSDSLVRQLTMGQFNVDKIVAVFNDTLYFTSGLIDVTTRRLADAAQSHLYFVSLDDATKLVCVTCDDNCLYNEIGTAAAAAAGAAAATGAAAGEYYVRTCYNGGSDIGKVPIVDINTFGRNCSQKFVAQLESNEELARKLNALSLPRMKRLSMPIQGTNFNASIILWLPPNFDETKKYPLLIDVYGGPGTQKVSMKGGIEWGHTLSSSHNVIYASIDGRGSGRVSDSLMFAVYRSLGKYEIDDQISAAEFLAKNLPYISSIAIWGWSYGGYVTAMVLGRKYNDLIKCGISVAPVTSWALYDTIYTERYMGLPTENFDAYNASDVTNYVENFRSKKFLLVHGNADDNVHYQQSMVLARALEKHDILFRIQSYPDEAHGLGGVRLHLYHTLQDFLLNSCFSHSDQ